MLNSFIWKDSNLICYHLSTTSLFICIYLHTHSVSVIIRIIIRCCTDMSLDIYAIFIMNGTNRYISFCPDSHSDTMDLEWNWHCKSLIRIMLFEFSLVLHQFKLHKYPFHLLTCLWLNHIYFLGIQTMLRDKACQTKQWKWVLIFIITIEKL